MQISNEDLNLIRKFEELKQKGFYCDSTLLTQVYNRVLNKNVNNTSCGSCMRQRISELVEVANKFERMIALDNKPNEVIQSHSESVLEEELTTTPPEENKAVKKAKNGAKVK